MGWLTVNMNVLLTRKRHVQLKHTPKPQRISFNGLQRNALQNRNIN
jgi:hypothetical protein